MSLSRKITPPGSKCIVPAAPCSNLGPQSQSCLCLQNRRQGSSAPVVIRRLASRDGLVLATCALAKVRLSGCLAVRRERLIAVNAPPDQI